MSGYYELKPAAGGKFMFNLKADNHETIFTSEIYTEKSSAKTGIASVQTNSPKDDHYKRLTSKKDEPYFTLQAGNNEVIGSSEMYTSTVGRDNGITSCKKNGPTTVIKDLA